MMDDCDTGSSASAFGRGNGVPITESPKPAPLFVRALQGFLYVLTTALFTLLVVFLAFQGWVFYLPAFRAAIDPSYKPEFPQYAYKVWGEDFNGTNAAEPWVILAVSLVVTGCTGKFVVFAPSEKQHTVHSKQD
eukprot:TRINITY_DN14334_c0_g1_i1.p1 TRINITY_DN14334_c0_g1~~TRINITY_DN14334_c0_g1_i1.p1  ORF type:complete len:134 (+),score=21.20 TRINITY_DN14334_c0_g1_i1:50-451(+)